MRKQGQVRSAEGEQMRQYGALAGFFFGVMSLKKAQGQDPTLTSLASA